MKLPNDWQSVVHTKYEQEYFSELMERVERAYAAGAVYPAREDIFKALELCLLADTKVVILGQDPYHGLLQAHGLAFSVRGGAAVPPSLRNIFREIARDVGQPATATSDLTRWATQGVLLLNSVLTVEAAIAGSHQKLGWQALTDAIVRKVSNEQRRVVFILWGAYAGAARPLIDESKHLVLTAPHPSPLSAYRGFLGCGHFSATNASLRAHGKSPIEW